MTEFLGLGAVSKAVPNSHVWRGAPGRRLPLQMEGSILSGGRVSRRRRNPPSFQTHRKGTNVD